MPIRMRLDCRRRPRQSGGGRDTYGPIELAFERTNIDQKDQLYLLQDRSDGEAVKRHRLMQSRFKDSRLRECPAVTNAFGERAIADGKPLAFARNDLLFTMSDNTHAHALQSEQRANLFFSRTSLVLPPSLKLRRTTFADRRLACQPERRNREGWWSQTGSNRRPPACKAGALPTELWPRKSTQESQRHPALSGKWWAWEDLNFRPHAYQARALTN